LKKFLSILLSFILLVEPCLALAPRSLEAPLVRDVLLKHCLGKILNEQEKNLLPEIQERYPFSRFIHGKKKNLFLLGTQEGEIQFWEVNLGNPLHPFQKLLHTEQSSELQKGKKISWEGLTKKLNSKLPYWTNTLLRGYQESLSLQPATEQAPQKSNPYVELFAAYEFLLDAPPGTEWKEKIELSEDLINKKYGYFLFNFPLPKGKIGKRNLSINLGGDLSSVTLRLKKIEGGMQFDFTGINKKGVSTSSTWKWNRKTNEFFYFNTKHEKIKSIQDCYVKLLEDSVELETESEEIKLSELINQEHGCFLPDFPLPNGGRVGKGLSINLGQKASSITLRLKKIEEGIQFDFTGINKKGNAVFSTWIWNKNSHQFYNLKQKSKKKNTEIAVNHLQNFYTKLLKPSVELGTESHEIELSEDLINKTYGRFMPNFPLPNGGSLEKKNLLINLGQNLSSVTLRLKKIKGGLQFDFRGIKKDKSSVTSTWIWEEETNNFYSPQQEDKKAGKKEAIESLRALYADFMQSDAGRVSDWMVLSESLANKEHGNFRMGFPLPEGETIEKPFFLGIAQDSSSIKFRLQKIEGGLQFDFTGIKENKPSQTSTWIWEKGKTENRFYCPAQETKKEEKEKSIKSLRTLYTDFMQSDAGRVSDWMVLSESLADTEYGKFQIDFPLPEGERVGKKSSFFIGRNLSSIKFRLKRIEGGLQFDFIGYNADGCSLTSTWIWEKGKTKNNFYCPKQEAKKARKKKAITSLRTFYANFMQMDVGTLSDEMVLSESLADKEYGTFQIDFPLPEGEKVGEKSYLGISNNLSSITLRLERIEKGLRFNFTGYKAGGSSVSSIWIWNQTQKTFTRQTEEAPIENLIKDMGLEKAVSSLGWNPKALYSYILLTTSLSPGAAGEMTATIFKGLREAKFVRDFSEYSLTLENKIESLSCPESTGENMIVLEGHVSGGFSQLQFLAWQRDENGNRKLTRNRVIPVDENGNFKTSLFLEAGVTLDCLLFSFQDEPQEKGEEISFQIMQTSPPQNLAEILNDLLRKKNDVREKIQNDSYQMNYMRQSLEIGLLKNFTENENQGFAVLEQKIKDHTGDPLMEMLLKQIQKDFLEIALLEIPDFARNERPYFYQKYVLQKVQTQMQDPTKARGKILALDPRLGKTLIFLALARQNSDGALIATPNNVVTSLGEMEDRFFEHPRSVLLKGPTSRKKKQLKEALSKAFKIFNIEFLRGVTSNNEKGKLLNKNLEQMIILDESQFLTKTSQQADGAKELQGSFYILSSATPVANETEVRFVLKYLDARSPAFKNSKIFTKMFHRSDPESLRLLHFLFSEYLIRIQKQDVFDFYDPEKPLEEQKDRLPRKRFIDTEELGGFELLPEQEESIFELFTQWSDWVKKNKGQKRTLDDETLQKKANSSNYFSKFHSILQIENHPKYIGVQKESPKYKKMNAIVNREVREKGGKVLIFTPYRQQVKNYVERYKELGFVSYYGDTDKEGTTSEGYVADSLGVALLFKKQSENAYAIGPDGKLITDSLGGPITRLEYNKLRFQHDPEVKGMVLTYNTGAVGINLTAATAVIRDGLDRNYTSQFQADERSNGIDNERKRYETRYYTLMPKYSEAFLEKMKKIAILTDPQSKEHQIKPMNAVTAEERGTMQVKSAYEVLFKNGTLTNVLYQNQKVQEIVFTLLMSGIGSDSALDMLSGKTGYLKEALPMLFENEFLPETEETEAEQEDEQDAPLPLIEDISIPTQKLEIHEAA
jgi:hypothetical protein